MKTLLGLLALAVTVSAMLNALSVVLVAEPYSTLYVSGIITIVTIPVAVAIGWVVMLPYILKSK